MGLRGPSPMPSAKRKAKGDTSKIGAHRLKRLGDSEPQATIGAPELPPGMSPAARKEWKRVIPELLATPGLLTTIDGDALAAYCEDVANLKRFRKQLQSDGDIVQGATGPVLHPLLKQIDVLETRCIQHRREFGMTPSARTRVQIAASQRKPTKRLDAILDAPRTSESRTSRVQ